MPCLRGCFDFLASERKPWWPKRHREHPLRIGSTIPNFYCHTTKGNFKFHQYLKGDPERPWTIFFSHPRDYTPVCTTELGECHVLTQKFREMGAKLIGISCDSVMMHHGWARDIMAHMRCLGENPRDEISLEFPVIADTDRTIVTAMGMLDPEEISPDDGLALPARALIVLFGTQIKLIMNYPATTGRDFDEVFRVLTSLQITEKNSLATPAGWKYGERVIVDPTVKTEEAIARFRMVNEEALPSGKSYMRSVECPEAGMQAPSANPHRLPKLGH